MSTDHRRTDFPALRQEPGRTVPVYLDSACMSLVPRPVLRAMESYYQDFPGCAGRSLHRFAEEVGRRYEGARTAYASWFGRRDPSGIVFVRNATEAINLVAQGLTYRPGDRILVSDREHNSNLVVWQRLAAERGIRLDTLQLPEDGSFDFDAFETALASGVRVVSFFHTSNLDGRSLPIGEITERAHAHGALVLFDGTQAAPHLKLDLDRLGVDFYAVSAHKMLGPTGVGVLAAAPGPIAELRPLVIGGETVEWSTLTDHALRPPPHRFEAGLQNYAGVIGAHAALDYLARVGPPAITAQQLALNRRVSAAFEAEPRFRPLGPADPEERPSILAFTLDGIDPHDAALFLDEGYDVMVRSGQHCVHSFYERRGLSGNVRASFYLYNDRRDADRLIDGLTELLGRLSGTSAVTPGPVRPRARARPRASESTAAAARSAPPRRTAAPGRAASARGSG